MGAEAAGWGPGLSHWQPEGQSRGGIGKLLGGREEQKGSSCAASADPRRGRPRAGDGGPGASLCRATSQTEILHFQAVENVKFPCSEQEAHRRVGTLVTVAHQTSVWQKGCC